MDERLAALVNFLNRNLDRFMVGFLIIILIAILGIKVTEEIQPPVVFPATPYTLKTYIPNPEYNAAIAYSNLNPDIDTVASGKYEGIKIFNPFDKQIIVTGTEIEKLLNQLLNDAQAAFDSGDYNKCIEICNKVLGRDFSNIRAQDLKKKSQERLNQN